MPVSYYSYHVGPLGLFTSFLGLSWPICFHHVSSTLFPLSSFFIDWLCCYWALCQKRVSTPTKHIWEKLYFFHLPTFLLLLNFLFFHFSIPLTKQILKESTNKWKETWNEMKYDWPTLINSLYCGGSKKFFGRSLKSLN